MTLGILNTIIALVVVLLVLSLLVQSVQTLIKKLLKLKSGQIKASLEDLYEQAIQRTNTPIPPFGKRVLTKLQRLFKRGAVAKSNAERFSESILNEFKGIGRVTVFGRPVLDSLSKDDLLKVMGKLELERFFPQYVAKFEELRTHIADLAQAIQAISKNEALRGAIGTKVAELRSVLAPIFNDIESIADADLENGVRPRALFADLLRLKKLDIHRLLDLLGQAQNALAEERDAAANSRDPETVDKLNELSGLLNNATTLVGGLSEKFDDAVMPLRNKREQVELWFDTVTQSFDERYTRHMRTISILISIVVVILLNANFFRVYKNISTNEVQRNLIAESGTGVLELARRSVQTPSPSPAPSPAAALTSPSPSPSPGPSVDPIAVIKETQKEIDELTRTYEGFGFSPLSWKQVVTAYKGFFGGKTQVRNAGGDVLNAAGNPIARGCESDNDDVAAKDSCMPAWRPQTSAEWRASRRADIFTIFGWAIMTMLLSVGAPFWQDTLESLFGIKNLLRQKSETQNIEKKSGSGQPRE